MVALISVLMLDDMLIHQILVEKVLEMKSEDRYQRFEDKAVTATGLRMGAKVR